MKILNQHGVCFLQSKYISVTLSDSRLNVFVFDVAITFETPCFISCFFFKTAESENDIRKLDYLFNTPFLRSQENGATFWYKILIKRTSGTVFLPNFPVLLHSVIQF